MDNKTQTQSPPQTAYETTTRALSTSPAQNPMSSSSFSSSPVSPVSSNEQKKDKDWFLCEYETPTDLELSKKINLTLSELQSITNGNNFLFLTSQKSSFTEEVNQNRKKCQDSQADLQATRLKHCDSGLPNEVIDTLPTVKEAQNNLQKLLKAYNLSTEKLFNISVMLNNYRGLDCKYKSKEEYAKLVKDLKQFMIVMWRRWCHNTENFTVGRTLYCFSKTNQTYEKCVVNSMTYKPDTDDLDISVTYQQTQTHLQFGLNITNYDHSFYHSSLFPVRFVNNDGVVLLSDQQLRDAFKLCGVLLTN